MSVTTTNKMDYTTSTSLDTLNMDCILELVKYMELADCINLAETCVSLKNAMYHVYTKCTTFELNRMIVRKGEKYVDRVLRHIGHYISSLTFKCACNFEKNYTCSRAIDRIKPNNITSLRICNLSNSCQKDFASLSFGNVEILTLMSSINCLKKNFINDFLDSFNNLKSLNIFFVAMKFDELKSVFRKNPGIVTFVLRRVDVDVDAHFDCDLLELIPAIEILVLDTFKGRVDNLSSLSKFNRIEKLRINCENQNLNGLIDEMARNGTMEELELHYIQVNDRFFDILKSFEKLRLLVISYSFNNSEFSHKRDFYCTLNPKVMWPFGLKYLLLDGFQLSHSSITSIIRQLKYLESLDLTLCDIDYNDKSYFNDVTKLSQQILEMIEDGGRQHRLDLVMPSGIKWINNHSKKYLFQSEKFRILRGESWKNPLGIKILFPGYNKNDR